MKTSMRQRKGLSRAEAELEAWLERARGNQQDEPAFFRRLLAATVYVHTPASDDSGKVRLIQFRHPDGFDAIPFFTSQAKALAASATSVRILNLAGRDLLAGTRGATLMLNPNNGGMVLYPEEITTLLKAGVLARIEKISTPSLDVRPAQRIPAWLVPALRTCLQGAEFVCAAYLLEARPADGPEQVHGMLICLVANPVYAERAARLVTSAIQPLGTALDPVIDLVVHDVNQALPFYLTELGLAPVFSRTGQT